MSLLASSKMSCRCARKTRGLCGNTIPNSASNLRIRLMQAVRSSLKPSRNLCTHRIPCCSIILTDTKRICGWLAASQMAGEMSETSWGRRKYRTTNWKAYNAALKVRGDLTIWLDRDMQWLAPPKGKRGRCQKFSDAAIQFCLTIQCLFGQPLRQTLGLVQSLLRMAGLLQHRGIRIKTWTVLCRKSKARPIFDTNILQSPLKALSSIDSRVALCLTLAKSARYLERHKATNRSLQPLFLVVF